MNQLPSEWKLVSLGDLVMLRTGPFGSSLHQADYIYGGVPIINPMHIMDGQVFPTPDMSVTAETANRLSEFRLRKGDVVMGRRGEMGRCAVVDVSQEGWLCGTGSIIIRPGPALVPGYLQRFLTSAQTIRQIEDTSVGSTMINLNQGSLRGLSIPLPPLLEQLSISTALSDIDSMARALDTLLAKKRNIMQGAIQQLLTGKTRLPGFRAHTQIS